MVLIVYNQVMKKVSIQDLKATLSMAIAEAEHGRTIVITRHNEPVAHLGPARQDHVHRAVSREPIRAVLKKGTKGRSLAVLLEDRGSR
jgi:prevent-host-death family protein